MCGDMPGFCTGARPLRCTVYNGLWRPCVISTISLQRNSGTLASKESPRRSAGIKPFKERGTKQQEVAIALNPTVPTRGWNFSHRICRRAFTLSLRGCEQVQGTKGALPWRVTPKFLVRSQFIKVTITASDIHGMFMTAQVFYEERAKQITYCEEEAY